MTPYGILGLALLSVVVTVILALVFPRRQYKYKPIIQSASDIPVEHRYGSRSNMSFEKIRAEQPVRTFGKRPVPPLNSITLTARQLEHVNIQRKLRNRPPLNRAGFNNAVAHAWDQPRRQPDTSVNWLTYLILYEAFFDDHKTSRVACDASIAIRPDQPFNGQGGEYAGAGASGDWTSPPSALAAAGAAIALTPLYGPQSDDWASAGDPAPALLEPGSGYSDPTPNNPTSPPSDDAPIIDRSADGNPESYSAPASAPDPSPSYSAPDPSPSGGSD